MIRRFFSLIKSNQGELSSIISDYLKIMKESFLFFIISNPQKFHQNARIVDLTYHLFCSIVLTAEGIKRDIVKVLFHFVYISFILRRWSFLQV